VNVVPFDSQRRRVSTVHSTGEGCVLYCKGAPEVVLARCANVESEEGSTPLSAELRGLYTKAAERMAHSGLRVLAFASRAVEQDCDPAAAECEMTLAGLVGLEDPPRSEVPEAIRLCREAGIRVIMVTGDHPETAAAVARDIGLVRSARPVVLTGEMLQALSDTQLQLALDHPEVLFARVAAEQKMRIVSALVRKREIVAVTGDGVNDAPALRRADVGVAMGRSGTDVAREAADVVLLDDNFASIVAAVREGRAVFANIRKFLTYILTSNVPEIVPYLAFVIFRVPLPLTVMQILAVDLGTDMLPALALGAEKPEPDVMKVPPRPRRARLLDLPLLLRAYLLLGPLQAIAAMSAYFFVLRGGGWRFGETISFRDPLYLQATTACLAAIVLMQVVNVFLCRSERQPAFASGFLGNRLIFAGVAAELVLVLAIVYTPVGNALFGTHPLPFLVWLFVLPFALAMAAIEEIRKGIARRSPRP
jgi:magnesium-transporting ATPase (P-type)